MSKVPLLVVRDQTIQETSSTGLADALAVLAATLKKLYPAATNLYRDVVYAPGRLANALQREEFEAVMLFGHDDNAADTTQADRDAFYDFVRTRRKGCFATGDHGSRGKGLCGSLFGISAMRRWSIPDNPDSGANMAIDTRVYPIDEILPPPKQLYPVLDYFGNPHRLLRKDSGACISGLPDHEHEGDCSTPAQFYDGGQSFAIKDVAYAVARRRSQSVPVLLPVLRCVDNPALGPLVVDSTVHHWMRESTRVLYQDSNWRSDIDAYYRNVLLFILRRR